MARWWWSALRWSNEIARQLHGGTTGVVIVIVDRRSPNVVSSLKGEDSVVTSKSHAAAPLINPHDSAACPAGEKIENVRLDLASMRVR